MAGELQKTEVADGRRGGAVIACEGVSHEYGRSSGWLSFGDGGESVRALADVDLAVRRASTGSPRARSSASSSAPAGRPSRACS